MSDELKPCPFCGNDAIRIMREGYVDPEFVGCPKCDVFMRPRRWNARHEPDELPEWAIEGIRMRIEQNKTNIACSIDTDSRRRWSDENIILNMVLSLRKPEAHS